MSCGHCSIEVCSVVGIGSFNERTGDAIIFVPISIDNTPFPYRNEEVTVVVVEKFLRLFNEDGNATAKEGLFFGCDFTEN